MAITGGEPCLHPGLPELMREIRALGYGVKLDTNGYHPDRLRVILEEGLADYVAMDIKNSAEKYALTCGVDSLDLAPIFESIALLKEGRADYEFRTTVVQEFHTAEDFHKMGEMIAGAKRYFLQRFTDRDTVPFEGLHAPSPAEMAEFREIAAGYVTETALRGVD